jgi:hypothetical protein
MTQNGTYITIRILKLTRKLIRKKNVAVYAKRIVKLYSIVVGFS